MKIPTSILYLEDFKVFLIQLFFSKPMGLFQNLIPKQKTTSVFCQLRLTIIQLLMMHLPVKSNSKFFFKEIFKQFFKKPLIHFSKKPVTDLNKRPAILFFKIPVVQMQKNSSLGLINLYLQILFRRYCKKFTQKSLSSCLKAHLSKKYSPCLTTKKFLLTLFPREEIFSYA